MDIDVILQQVRDTAASQLRLAGDDPAVVAAGEAVLAALDPAFRQAVSSLAEQAAAEISSQLDYRTVDVLLSDGRPTLVVRTTSEAMTVNTEECDARMTVRLPEDLKDDLETVAGELGDSVNTYVVKALAGSAEAIKRASRSNFEGTIET